MLIHFSILALILLLSLIYENRIKEEKLVPILEGKPIIYSKSTLAPWLLLFSLIVFYASVRQNVNDTYVYMNIFNDLEASWDSIISILSDTSKDKGFYILQNLFKMYVSTDFHMWFLFIALIEGTILVAFFRKRSTDFLISMFFFFCSTMYYNFFSMMRQWLAVCIVILAFQFVEKRKFVPYLLLCLLAAQFHNSAYFVIPVFFLVQGALWGKKQISIIGLFFCCMLLLQPILSSLENSTQDATYSYVVSAMNSNNGSSIIRPIIAIVPVVLSYIAKKRMEGKDRTIDLCVNYSLLNFMLSFLAVFTSGLYITRLSTYFNVYNVILYPYLLNVAYKDQPNQKLIKTGFYIFYFAFYMFDMIYSGAFPYFSDVIGYFG